MLQKLSVRLSSLIFHNMRTLSNTVCPFCSGRRYYSLNDYCKETFGEKVYRLSLSGGMTCPNRDGTYSTLGCAFCSEGGSGDFAASASLPVSQQLSDAKIRIAAKTNCSKFIAYFQSYTNTYAPVAYLCSIYEEALQSPEIVALSIGTRSDCLGEDVLLLLSELQENIRTSRYGLSLDYRRCTTTHYRK